ncbi:hypothetical protein [Aquimarina sp. 2201CG14-23]|uniref:hypothetical protein n=1 Tax=Aquimarina mycalae TaxID=3040073 RepID=UPI002477D6BD|nr:hypothetical protein [Aquimarina sp. 2201CG14-23]MDH7445290.1 hypothetical protein [Aquimarina sp. 2201CG14-23]
MEEKLHISDLKRIIHNLIVFIVIEGKEYVNDKKKREYVASYVHLLAKVINQIEEEERVSLVEDISNDISKYMK